MTGHQMNILEAKESKDAILNLWSYALKFLISMIRFSCIVVSEYPTGENMIELTVRFFFAFFEQISSLDLVLLLIIFNMFFPDVVTKKYVQAFHKCTAEELFR